MTHRLTLILLLSLAGVAPAATPAERGPARPAAPKGPDKDECLGYGLAFVDAIHDGDEVAARDLYGFDAMIERALDRVPMKEATRKWTRAEFRKEDRSPTAELIRLVEAGAELTVLRAREYDGKPTVLLRVVDGDGCLSYREMVLGYGPGQAVICEDVRLLHMGETHGEIYFRAVAAMVREYELGVVGRMFAKERPALDMAAIFKVVELCDADRPQQALAAYRKLPARVKDEKIVRAVGLLVAAGVGDAAPLEAYRRDFPGDPAADIAAIDCHANRKEFDKSTQAIDRLDQYVGGDPFLHTVRAGVLLKAGDLPAAAAAAEKAIEENRGILAAFWMRIDVALAAKDHAGTADWLRRIADEHGVVLEVDFMRESRAYKDFVLSAECAELDGWLTAQRQ